MKKYPENRPKYKLIAEKLEKAMLSGEYKPGDRLPGAFQLAKQSGTSVVTANKALDQLAADGLVDRSSRSGTYVREGGDSLRAVLIPSSPLWYSENPQLLLYLHGLVEEANSLRIQIRIEPYDSPMLQNGDDVRALGCQGVIQLGDGDSSFPYQSLKSSNLPWVVVGTQEEKKCDHFVIEDRENSTAELVSKMRKDGLQKIAMIADLSKPNHRYCRNGYLKGMKTTGLGASLLRDSTVEGIDVVLKELINKKNNLDAMIVCGQICVRAVTWLWRHNISIPLGCYEESSAVGLMNGLAYLVCLNQNEVGKKALRILADLVSGKQTTTKGTFIKQNVLTMNTK